MKVVQLSKADRAGGASIAAFRLHRGLRSEGVESIMLVNNRTTTDPDVLGPQGSVEKAWASVAHNVDKFPLRLIGRSAESGNLSLSWVPDNVVSRLKPLNPDVINIHWVNGGYLRVESFSRLGYPALWTLHDMWAFCGAEHYVGNDQRYRDGYEPGNRRPGEVGWDVNRWVWNRKRRIWSQLKNFAIVTPSNWLADCVRNSRIMSHLPVSVIPNGIDHQLFKPLDHAFARHVLGLPQNRKLVLFGAGGGSDDPRKGFVHLTNALKIVSASNQQVADLSEIDLVIFGPPSRNVDLDGLYRTHYLGKLNDEVSLALAYAAADVFVAPSQQDNLPNTVLESLSCGTPVVAFNIGGMPDMILHEKCGYLAVPFDTNDLANGIRRVLALSGDLNWHRLSETAREQVMTNFTLPIQAQRYLSLYQSHISDGSG